MSKQWNGNPASPIKLRTHRQTEESTRSRQHDDSTDDENPNAWTQPKSRTSAVPYTTPPRRRETTTLPDPKKTRVFNQRRLDSATLMILLCLAVIVMVVGWFALNALNNWWQGVQENMKYGNPRTFQADQYMGLGDNPSHPDHFIAMNLHGEIEVIVLNPLDHTRDVVDGLTNVGNESIPVTLSFRDTSGSGKVDVVVTIGDSTPYTLVLLNNGKTFVPTQAAH